MVEKDIVQRITFEEYGPEFRELYELMKNFFNLPQNIKENYKDAISPTNDPTPFQICDVGYSRSGGRETYQIRTGNAGVPVLKKKKNERKKKKKRREDDG
eukprot:Phypoly_transcript_25704.p1 GENE.Phypoly_transcript_25704~~Phypoly_transcript_25704.p1  ORF type:complete len:100 (+),score=22.96 Phypoly_transcript_25704:3-302(+)